MRPIFSLCHVVGVVMLAYAVGVLSTPNSGVTNYLVDETFLTAQMIAAAFAVCGLAILILRPRPPLFSLLITPILLYGVASVLYFCSTPTGAFTAVAAHNGLWLVICAALYEKARRAC